MLSLLDGSKRFLQLIIGGQPSPDSARIGMIYGFLIILEGEASHCGPSAFSCQYEKLRVNSAEATALPTAIGTDCNNLFVGASLLSNVGLRAGGPLLDRDYNWLSPTVDRELTAGASRLARVARPIAKRRAGSQR
jgi:hypothetical protein